MSQQWELMRVEISMQPMPPEFAKTIAVFCNDCGASSFGERHFLGTPCGQCGSFNTAATDDADDVAAEDTDFNGDEGEDGSGSAGGGIQGAAEEPPPPPSPPWADS